MSEPHATKDYHLFFEHRPDYLYANVMADRISFDIAKKYWIEILKLRYERGYNKVLIEKNVKESLSAHSVVELVSQLANSGCSRNRFAIFDHNYDFIRSSLEQQAGTNRGLQLRIAPTMAEAIKWLGASTVPTQLEHDRVAELEMWRRDLVR
ncbi:MAG TPA: hypothetical protein PKA82_14290 [Pyrinomonadaceae bacterium]|nr:hypothetical protein [Pyrinomonadaceae bacterium]